MKNLKNDKMQKYGQTIQMSEV